MLTNQLARNIKIDRENSRWRQMTFTYTETRFAKYSNIYEVKVISDRGSGVNKPTFTCVDNGETTVKRANGRSVAV